MEIKTLTKEDSEDAVALYVRCMSESEYLKTVFHLRRGTDVEELMAVLAMEHGPMVVHAISYGASLGAWDAGRLVGMQVGFWYKVVRQNDGKLFGMAFRDKSGNLIDETGLHKRIAKLSGAVLYNLALCTDPGSRRDKIATRLLESAKWRLRPDWIVTAAHGTDAPAVYRSLGAETYELADGRALCILPA